MKKLSVDTEATYVGGSLDGKLVKPSLGNASIKQNLPIIHRENFFNEDYPIGIDEYYYPEENNGKVVFRFGKSKKTELITV